MYRNHPARSDRGFTLMEILVVLSIIALLGGLSVGAFRVANRNYMLAASAGQIQTILRAARNTSITSGTPSFVVIDPSTKTVKAQSYKTLEEWSFDGGSGEDGGGIAASTGARALKGTGPGRVGTGLSGGSYVACGNLPQYNVRDGIFIEAWVRHNRVDAVKPPHRVRRKQPRRLGTKKTSSPSEKALTIVGKKGAYFFGMTASGALEAAIGDYRVRTGPEVVAGGRWVFVTFRYDGKKLAVSADGVDRKTERIKTARLVKGKSTGDKKKDPVPTSIPVTKAQLTISSADSPFPGAIDEVRLRGRIEPLFYKYNDHEDIIGWKKVIHFDRRGRLDPAFHEEGVRIVLFELPDDVPESKTVVVIDYSLTYDEWLEKKGLVESKQSLLGGKKEEVVVSRRERERRIEERYRGVRKVVIEVDPLGVVK